MPLPTEASAAPSPVYDSPSLPVAPVNSGERLQSIDVLRGLALFFMILVHFHQLMRAEGSTGLQDMIGWGVWIFVEQKAWGVFAFLFGAGFALFLRRLDARGAPVVPIYLRRLATLAVIGIVIQWVLGFHILTTYASWGVALLFMRRWSTRALLLVAVLSAIAKSSILTGMALYAHYAGLPPSRPGVWWILVPDSNLVLFVLGLLAVRHRVLDEPLRHIRLIRGWMIGGAAAWAASWLVLVRVPETLPIKGLHRPLRMGFGLAYDQWLCLTYVGAVLLLLAYRPQLEARLALVGAAGRMALTNYVAQAAVIFVLYKPLGLEFHEFTYVAATLALFGAEMVFSRYWLARHRFGPLEWMWRMASYARRETLRRERLPPPHAQPA